MYAHTNRLRWDLDVDGLKSLTQTILADGKAALDKIGALGEGEHTWDNTVKAFVDAMGEVGTQSSSVTFPSCASPSKDLRDESNKLKQEISNFNIDVYMREDVFKSFVAYQEKGEELGPVEKRLVEKIINEFKRNGLAVPEQEREEIKTMQKRMNELKVKASQNMNEENTKLHFTREELKGVPDDFFVSREKEGEKYVLTLKYPDYGPVQKHCEVENTRKIMETAFNSRCMVENMPILDELIKLRRATALKMGWPDHASFILDVRMAKNTQTVKSFLDDLVEKMAPLVEKDLQKLSSYKKETSPTDDTIYGWDYSYYMNMLLEQEFKVDENKIKEYFPLDVVLNGLLEIYQEILSLKFNRVDDPNAWHPDVHLYEVTDRVSGDFVGHFYLDLHPREGKYGHAAVWGLQQGYRLADGSWQHPVAAMLCNFSKSTEEKPSLLKHSEVVTFFHEMGHVFHQICTKTKYKYFSGTNVERDFVEAPSQMLENWCWQAESLKRMSGHYLDKSKTIPDELVSLMVAAKLANIGLMTCRQLFFGLYDQYIHTAPEVEDAGALYAEMRGRVSKVPNTPGTCGAACWGHIFGGYDASYYGYLWSEVYSCDMFSLFEEGGVFNTELGQRYRKVILEQGGNKDGGDLIREFLGREPNNKAFLRDLGL